MERQLVEIKGVIQNYENNLVQMENGSEYNMGFPLKDHNYLNFLFSLKEEDIMEEINNKVQEQIFLQKKMENTIENLKSILY